MNRITELRVKIKYLAEESRIIRHEEHRALKSAAHAQDEESILRMRFQHASLHNHRVQDVRPIARHAQLAYVFLRGRAYSEVESPSTRNFPVWGEVRKLVKRFGVNYSFENSVR